MVDQFTSGSPINTRRTCSAWRYCSQEEIQFIWIMDHVKMTAFKGLGHICRYMVTFTGVKSHSQEQSFINRCKVTSPIPRCEVPLADGSPFCSQVGGQNNRCAFQLTGAYNLRHSQVHTPHQSGYPHNGHADKNPYVHDHRADKDSYPHDSNIQLPKPEVKAVRSDE